MYVDEITRLAGLPSVERIEVKTDGTVIVVTRTHPPAPVIDWTYRPEPFIPQFPEYPFRWVGGGFRYTFEANQ